jgi:HTH-type transcriptional regulator, sugar sensing transcriptional regulator
MAEDFQTELQELGLLPAEAQIYLALVRNGALGGSALASVTGFPRSSVYLTLNSLLDKGLIEGGAGHGSRFSVIPPEKALASLVSQEKEAVSQHEKLATQVGRQLSSLVEPDETVPEDFIQIIRSSRAVAERFDRLQLEAKQRIEVLSKAPIFNRPGNPVQAKALRRGIRARSIYEKAILDDPGVKPFFAKWIAAGEDARVYDGQLPHKLAIFDAKIALMPLILPGEQVKTVLIRHNQLVQTLTLAFEYLWERSEPIAPTRRNKPVKSGKNVDRKGKQPLGSNSSR